MFIKDRRPLCSWLMALLHSMVYNADVLLRKLPMICQMLFECAGGHDQLGCGPTRCSKKAFHIKLSGATAGRRKILVQAIVNRHHVAQAPKRQDRSDRAGKMEHIDPSLNRDQRDNHLI